MQIKERLWTAAQFPRLEELAEKFQIPLAVVDEIQKTVRILDCHYGDSRDVDQDDGGFVLLLLSESKEEIERIYDATMQKYFLQRELAEFEDVIVQNRQKEWHIALYLVGSEYGITIIYPAGRKEKNG